MGTRDLVVLVDTACQPRREVLWRISRGNKLATSNISSGPPNVLSNGTRVHLLRVSRALWCARWRKQTEEFEERGEEAEVGGVSEGQSGLPRRCIALEKGSSEISSPPNRPSSLARFPLLLATSRRIIARSSLIRHGCGSWRFTERFTKRIADVLIRPKNLTRSLEISLLAKASTSISRSTSVHLNKRQRSSRGNVKREFKRIIGKLTGGN